MKSFVVAVCIFACAYATSSTDEQSAQVLQNDYSQSPEGNYQVAYKTENGISGQATGSLKSVGKDESALQVQGSNSYISPDGQEFSLTYIADENGYQPQGAHLPTPPAPEPIPEYIQRSLEYIRTHPYTEKK